MNEQAEQSKIQSPEHSLKPEGWQDPPHINKVKQYEAVLSFKVSLFIQFIPAWKQREFDYLICVSEVKLLVFWLEALLPKLQSAPLTLTHNCKSLLMI